MQWAYASHGPTHKVFWQDSVHPSRSETTLLSVVPAHVYNQQLHVVASSMFARAAVSFKALAYVLHACRVHRHTMFGHALAPVCC